MLLQMLVMVFGTLACAVALMAAVRWFMRRWLAQQKETKQVRHCPCGYLLAGLEVPRCPECGRLIGFDKTVEELGISEAELREQAARKKATQGN